MNTLEPISVFLNDFLIGMGLNPEFVFLGNTTSQYFQALIAFLGFFLVFKLFQFLFLSYLSGFAKKTKTDVDDTLIEIVGSLKPPFYLFLTFYLALQFLTLHAIAIKTVEVVLIVWVVYQVIIAAQIFLNYLIRSYSGSTEEDDTSEGAIMFLGKIASGILWALGVLMILSNLGINVSSLIAGLGIGGIAIAFALQNILSDLFSSFAIYFDKPFKVGDFIIVGEHLGTVEKIGIKTTRLRALRGEELVFSNKELTSARIQNFKKMEDRRVTLTFGVEYQTSLAKLKKIPGIVKEVVETVKKTRFDRAHFHKFGDSSLDFEVVYYVSSADYNEYMDINQKIHLALKEDFEKEGIEFAYPTRTMYMKNE